MPVIFSTSGKKGVAAEFSFCNDSFLFPAAFAAHLAIHAAGITGRHGCHAAGIASHHAAGAAHDGGGHGDAGFRAADT